MNPSGKAAASAVLEMPESGGTAMGMSAMKLKMIAMGLAALALGGCSTSGMLEKLGMGGGTRTAAATPTVQTGNPLAMPPDLRLKQPGAVADNTYQPNTVAGEPVDQTASAAPVTPVAPVAKQDVYAEYGISKTNPDGTPKNDQALKKELKAAILKRKQQQNPNYGTFKNFGAIFSDG
jgi:hypothetical protein